MRAPAPSPWVAVAEAAGSARMRAGARNTKPIALPKRGRAELRLPVQKPDSLGLRLDVQKRVGAWAPRRADLTAWASAALGRRAANAELSVRLVGRAEGRKLNAHYRGKDYATNVLSFPASPAATPPRRVATRKAMPAAMRNGAAEAARVTAPGAAPEPLPLGDLVICPPVLRAEALAQRKTLRAHWAHLVVHGSLHLIGYDHERDDDARRMERREIAVLRRLGFANPYLSTS